MPVAIFQNRPHAGHMHAVRIRGVAAVSFEFLLVRVPQVEPLAVGADPHGIAPIPEHRSDQRVADGVRIAGSGHQMDISVPGRVEDDHAGAVCPRP